MGDRNHDQERHRDWDRYDRERRYGRGDWQQQDPDRDRESEHRRDERGYGQGRGLGEYGRNERTSLGVNDPDQRLLANRNPRNEGEHHYGDYAGDRYRDHDRDRERDWNSDRGGDRYSGPRHGNLQFSEHRREHGEHAAEGWGSHGPADRGAWRDREADWPRREYRGGDSDRGSYAQRWGGQTYGTGSHFAYGGALAGEETGKYFGRGPKGYRRSDERIREDINEELTRNPRLDATDIEVSVQDGEVTLSGVVENRHAKREAEESSYRVSGVRDVHNHLRTKGGIGSVIASVFKGDSDNKTE